MPRTRVSGKNVLKLEIWRRVEVGESRFGGGSESKRERKSEAVCGGERKKDQWPREAIKTSRGGFIRLWEADSQNRRSIWGRKSNAKIEGVLSFVK